jgi:excisionase family DNA binding protein
MVRLLDIPMTAERLGVKESTVRFWVWQRKIEYVKVGRCVRVPESAVERIIERGTVPEGK